MNGIPFTSEVGSRLRRAQLETEESMAQELRDEGFKVFSPTVVCDRVATKDGQVYFVEFKNYLVSVCRALDKQDLRWEPTTLRSQSQLALSFSDVNRVVSR